MEDLPIASRPLSPPAFTSTVIPPFFSIIIFFSQVALSVTLLLSSLEIGIQCVFHYVPLLSPFAIKHGYASRSLRCTDDLSSRLVRLPMWVGLEDSQDQIIDQFLNYLFDKRP